MTERVGLNGEFGDGETIPGSLEFLTYASEKGIKVFYVSNRYSEQLESTINNLKRLGFPNVSESTVLLRSDSK